MALTYANILFPLYIYPYPLTLWSPLTEAAAKYPDITFTAVINPSDGPWPQDDGCPNQDLVEGLSLLNAQPNIRTMGYVHTANQWDCGTSGRDICVCSAPREEVKANITTYASWGGKQCKGWSTPNPDVHIDSVFIDEAPGDDGGKWLAYMADLTSHAKSVLTDKTGGEVLFNAGTKVDLQYFDIADVIVILEDTQERYEMIPDIGDRNGNGKYARKSSAIIHTASNATAIVERDASTILSRAKDSFHSLFYTDRATQQYNYFPYAWAEILEEVNKVAQANKAMATQAK